MFKMARSKTSQPSPQGEAPLPDYGLIYFHHLNAELRSLPASSIDPETTRLFSEIQQKGEQGALSWHDLHTFDLAISRLLPADRLRRKIWALRLRYRDAVGLREYEAYLASRPPGIVGERRPDNEPELRTDVEYLLGQLYLRYSLTPLADQVRDRISRRVVGIILVGLGAIVLVLVLDFAGFRQSYSAALPAAIFAGGMGGLLSLQQRYQGAPQEGDPLAVVGQLRQSWPRVLFPAISGAVFAFVLYMLLVGGLLSGDIFPSFVGDQGEQKGTLLLEFLRGGRPASIADYAKLIVWAFLAGFAERLVPDTLSKLISKQATASKKKTRANAEE